MFGREISHLVNNIVGISPSTSLDPLTITALLARVESLSVCTGNPDQRYHSLARASDGYITGGYLFKGDVVTWNGEHHSGTICSVSCQILTQAKIVHGSWACTYPCSCSKHNRFSLATPMKFGNFAPYFMLFMPTIIVTSCTFHALFMPISCMFMAWTGYEQRL